MKIIFATLLAIVFLTCAVSASDEYGIILQEGWNLVYGFTEVSQINAGTLKQSDILAIYGFLPEEQRYVELHPNTDYDSLLDIQGAQDLDEQSAFWVYSNKEGSINYRVQEPAPLRDINLEKGWNLIGITENFRGYSLQEVLGTCEIERGHAFFNGGWKSISEFKNDDNFINTLSSTLKGGSSTDFRFRGIALQVKNDCSLAPPQQSAPTIPAFPSFPEAEEKHEPEKTIILPTVDNDPVLGDRNAKVTMIAFDDYQGPFNAQFYRETFPLIQRDYIDTGKVRYVVRDFPLDFHSSSMPAALTANCILAYGSSSDFWKFHKTVFPNQDKLNVAYLKQLARDILSYDEEIDSCIDSQAYKSEVDKDIQDVSAAGVQGTPTFFINGQRIDGAQPYIVFKEALDAAITKA